MLARKEKMVPRCLGFKNPITGVFEPKPSPSEVKRLLMIIGEVVSEKYSKSVG